MAIAGNVTVIPPKRTIGTQKKTETVQKTRVAAYCRVSTKFEEQESSYEMQVEHYTSYIMSNPDWELVEVYADDGISATNTAKRESFNRMIQDCRDGKIDMILTKSISRFSRNTVDCLKFTRELKGMNISVSSSETRQERYRSTTIGSLGIQRMKKGNLSSSRKRRKSSGAFMQSIWMGQVSFKSSAGLRQTAF